MVDKQINSSVRLVIGSEVLVKTLSYLELSQEFCI